jgi:hypothetical protein
MPVHRKLTSTRLTCIVVAVVVLMLIAVVRWYVQ